MFYEVKVFDAEGQLKKVLSPKKLSNRFWKEGEQRLIDFTDKDSVSVSGNNKNDTTDEFQLEDSWLGCRSIINRKKRYSDWVAMPFFI